MPENLLEKLKETTLLLDSAMGTMLLRAGLKSGEECGELWNVNSNRGKVRKIHEMNVEAGSDIIITNTFGGSSLKLAHYDLAERAGEINREGALVAREASGEGVYVAGDIGPTGEILEQWGGTKSAGEILAVFDEQVAGLLEGGVDLFILETFMDVEELRLALQAVRNACRLPVIASMTFETGPDGAVRTMWGLTPDQVARDLEDAGADIAGSNCGMGTRQMLRVVTEMARSTGLPLAAQPNAGSPEVREGKTVYSETAEDMAALAPEFKAAGAKIIGGCCGTTPEYIAAIRNRLGL
ncbi:MAG: homocysteine S-methyltransferase family protein [Gemmatimonadota bacterium]|nr:homocysteine S-methyltransferase family protein [Gemmatimonadota bacterium]